MICSSWRCNAGARCARRCVTRPQTENSRTSPNVLQNANAVLSTRRRLRSMPGCSAATAAGSESCGGSAMRPMSPSDTQRLRLIHLPRGNAAPNAPGVVVWAGRKADDPLAVAAARIAMLGETEDEYRRLLYVAMTRAADLLILGGCMPGNMNAVRTFSWS